MVLVLEWRNQPPSAQIGRGMVSYLRVFRTVPALKAFVRSKKFAPWFESELRLCRRKAGEARTIITDRAAILGWNDEHQALPLQRVGSQWERDLSALDLSQQVQCAVAHELDRARRGNLLTSSEADDILHFVRRTLAGSGQD